MTMTVQVNGQMLAFNQVCEALPGDTLELRQAGDLFAASSPITLQKAPDGATPTIDGRTLSGFSEPGLYRFKVAFANDLWRWVDVFVFEPTVLDLVDSAQSGLSTRSDAERRLVLRGLAQHPTERCDGSRKAITERGVNLGVFGA